MGDDSHSSNNQDGIQGSYDSNSANYPTQPDDQFGNQQPMGYPQGDFPQEPLAAAPGNPVQPYNQQPAYGAAPAQPSEPFQPGQTQPSQTVPPVQSVPASESPQMPQGQGYAQYQPQGNPPFNGQPQVAPANNSYSGMSIASLILAFLVPIVGLILAIISLFGFRKNDRRKGKGLSIAAVVISVIMMIGSSIFAYNVMNKAADQISRSVNQSSVSPFKSPSRSSEGDGAGKYKTMQDWIDKSPEVKEFQTDIADPLKQRNIIATLKAGGDEKLILDLLLDVPAGQAVDTAAAQRLFDQSDLSDNMSQLARELKGEGFKHPTVEVTLHTADNSVNLTQVNDENGKVS